MIRHPIFAAASQARRYKRRLTSKRSVPMRETMLSFFNYHPIVFFLIWRRAAVLLEQSASRSKRVLELRYEDLTDHRFSALETVCKHCSIEYSTDMETIEVLNSSFTGDGSALGLVNQNNEWRRHSFLLEAVAALLVKNQAASRRYDMQQHGFIAQMCSLAFCMITLLIKSPFIFMLNWQRFSSIYAFLQTRFLK